MKPFSILCLFVLYVSARKFDYSTLSGPEWDETRAGLIKTGTCVYFYNNPTRESRFDGICIEHCAKKSDSTSSGCDWTQLAQLTFPEDYDPSLISYDQGEPLVLAKCKCNNPEIEYLVGQLIGAIVEALGKLAEIICDVVQEIMPVIKATLKALDIATDVVPLPQAKMAKLLITSAKTFYENGLGEDEFFDKWVKDKCGSVKHPGNVFDNLLNAPDSHGKSEGCFKKNKAKCRKVNPRPDTPKKGDEDSKNGSQGKDGKDDKGGKPTTKADEASSRPASTTTSKALSSSASKTITSSQESKSSTSIVSSKASSNPTSSTPRSTSLSASALTHSSSAISSPTSSSSSSSSASPSSTEYICGQSCGKKGCAVNPSKASSGKQPKVTKRSEYFKKLIGKRTLGTVPEGKADDYVLEAITRASKVKENELDYTFSNDFAVSKHGEFLNEAFPVFLTGLEGCTGIAVISEKGYWISHFMELAMVSGEKAKWDNLWAATTKGNSKYTRPDTLTDIFGEGSNPRIYLMRPLHADTGKALYNTEIDKIMGQVQSGILQTATTHIWKYKKPKNLQELDTIFEKTARGKMLIEYSNNQQAKSASLSSQATSTTAAPSQATPTAQQSAAARIFMETQADERSWAASEVQRNGKKEDGKNSDKPVPEHRSTCLKDDSNTVNLSDVETAFMDAFKTAIDVKNPVSQTGTSGATKIQFNFRKSASQAGCNKSDQTKMMKMLARKFVAEATKQCPKGADGTVFMGVKPDIVNTAIGCVDFEVFKV